MTRRFTLGAVLLSTVLLAGAPARCQQPARLVCVGGTLTEIVFALGAGDSVVGVDSSSVFPPEARERAQLGYQRALAAEGLLALEPTLVLVTPDAGPPAVLRQVRDAGVTVAVIPAETSPAGVEAKIAAVARALGRQAQGDELSAALRRDIDEARSLLAEAQAAVLASPGAAAAPVRVLCVYARARGALHVCGSDTPLDAMVRLAGGVNAVDDLRGARPLGAEAAIAAAPDVILMPRGSAEVCGGAESLLADSSLQLTPAGRAGRVIVMDDLLLTGFGPRSGKALVELVRALHAPGTAGASTEASPEAPAHPPMNAPGDASAGARGDTPAQGPPGTTVAGPR